MLSGKLFVLLAFALATCHCSSWYQVPRRDVFYTNDLEQADDETPFNNYDDKDKTVFKRRFLYFNNEKNPIY